MNPLARLAERRRRLGFAAVFGVLFTLTEGNARIAEERAEAPCVFARSESPYRNYGYDHVVWLQNKCDGDVRCDVSSDVRTDPVNVVVPQGARVEVVLWRASPARTFKAKVECRWVE